MFHIFTRSSVEMGSYFPCTLPSSRAVSRPAAQEKWNEGNGRKRGEKQGEQRKAERRVVEERWLPNEKGRQEEGGQKDGVTLRSAETNKEVKNSEKDGVESEKDPDKQ